MKPRVLVAALLLNAILFVRGCDGLGTSRHSLGVLIPFADVTSGAEVGIGVLPGRMHDFSFAWLMVNGVAGAVISHVLFKHLERRRVWAALGATVALANSFIFAAVVWAIAIFVPTAALVDGLKKLLYFGQPAPLPDRLDDVLFTISSRFWLVCVFSLVYGLAIAASSLFRSRSTSDQRGFTA